MRASNVVYCGLLCAAGLLVAAESVGGGSESVDSVEPVEVHFLPIPGVPIVVPSPESAFWGWRPFSKTDRHTTATDG